MMKQALEDQRGRRHRGRKNDPATTDDAASVLPAFRLLSTWERLLTWATAKAITEHTGANPKAARAIGQKVARGIVEEWGETFAKWAS